MSTTKTLWERCEVLGPMTVQAVEISKRGDSSWRFDIDGNCVFVAHEKNPDNTFARTWLADMILQRFEAIVAPKITHPLCNHSGTESEPHCIKCSPWLFENHSDAPTGKCSIRDRDSPRLAALWQNMHGPNVPIGLHVVSSGRNGHCATLMNAGMAICDLCSHQILNLRDGYSFKIIDPAWTLERIEALFVEAKAESGNPYSVAFVAEQPTNTIPKEEWEEVKMKVNVLYDLFRFHGSMHPITSSLKLMLDNFNSIHVSKFPLS